jgi:hypothetical protein
MHVPTNLRENCRSESSLLYTKGKTETKKKNKNSFLLILHLISKFDAADDHWTPSIQLHLFMPVAFFTPSTAPCAFSLTC